MNDHLFGKELFIRFTASAFRKLPSIYVFSYFPFGFEGRMWDLIVSVPDHCLSFYFDSLLVLFRTAWWTSAWKELTSWLSACTGLLYAVLMFCSVPVWCLGKEVDFDCIGS